MLVLVYVCHRDCTYNSPMLQTKIGLFTDMSSAFFIYLSLSPVIVSWYIYFDRPIFMFIKEAEYRSN